MTTQVISSSSNSNTSSATAYYDDEAGFGRRVAITQLQEKHYVPRETAEFLLGDDRHDLADLYLFFAEHHHLLTIDAWLYPLTGADFRAPAKMISNTPGKMRIQLAWFDRVLDVHSIRNKSRSNSYHFYVFFTTEQRAEPKTGDRTFYRLTSCTTAHLSLIHDSPSIRASSSPPSSPLKTKTVHRRKSRSSKATTNLPKLYKEEMRHHRRRRGALSSSSSSSSSSASGEADEDAATTSGGEKRMVSKRAFDEMVFSRRTPPAPNAEERKRVKTELERACTSLQLRAQIDEMDAQRRELEQRMLFIQHDQETKELRHQLADAQARHTIDKLELEREGLLQKNALLDEKNALLKQASDKEMQLLREKEAFLEEKSLFYKTRAEQMQLAITSGSFAALSPSSSSSSPPPLTPTTHQPKNQSHVTNTNTLCVSSAQPFTLPPPSLTGSFDINKSKQAFFQREPEQFDLHQRLMPLCDLRVPHTSTHGLANLLVLDDNLFLLADVLVKVLGTESRGVVEPARQSVERAMLTSPLLEGYRIELRRNTSLTLPIGEQDFMARVFDGDAFANRFNLANVKLHCALLEKALSFDAWSTQTIGAPKHRPCVWPRLPGEQRGPLLTYGEDVRRRWFPCFSFGPGTVVSQGLHIYAESLKTGPGEGKTCDFCEQTYFAHSGGAIKNSHHTANCDILPHISNNERVILEVIMTRRRDCLAFANCDLMKSIGSETGLLRRATSEEIRSGRYVTDSLYPHSKLRINMKVLLKMREKAFADFLDRLRSLASSQKASSLLPLTALPHLVDFGALAARRLPTRTGGPSATATTKKKKKPSPSKVHGPRATSVARHPYESLLKCADTPLGRLLINFDGENYIHNLPLRDFTYNETTHFGDEMHFTTRDEEAGQRAREARERDEAAARAQAEAFEEAQQQRHRAQPVDSHNPFPEYAPSLGDWSNGLARSATDHSSPPSLLQQQHPHPSPTPCLVPHQEQHQQHDQFYLPPYCLHCQIPLEAGSALEHFELCESKHFPVPSSSSQTPERGGHDFFSSMPVCDFLDYQDHSPR